MASSKNLATYADVDRVFRAILRAGGGVFKARTLAGDHTPGAGSNWLQRAYRYRALYEAKANAAGTVSPFTEISLSRRCGCRAGSCKAEEEWQCMGHVIDLRLGVPVRGDLETSDGAPIDIEPYTTTKVEIDPLLELALSAKLGLDLEGEDE